MRIERAIDQGMVPPCAMGIAMRTVRRSDGPMTAWRYENDGKAMAWITYGPCGCFVRMVASGADAVRYVREVIDAEAARCGQPRTNGWTVANL